MKWLQAIRGRRAPIGDLPAVADFADEQAAFLAQKGIFEYARARAGRGAHLLFKERAFLDLIEQARWQAYPLALAMLGELIEGLLRPHAGEDRLAVLDRLVAVMLGVFDRYPEPPTLTPGVWAAAREDLARRLSAVGLHPPKRAIDIPEPYVEPYFALMPIHERLRTQDLPTVRNYLRITMCNIHETLSQRLAAPALVAALRPAAIDG